MNRIIHALQRDWKRTYALTVVYGYMYDIIFWPLAFWMTTMLTLWTNIQFPAPPLVPWEQLAVAAGLLVGIGTVQLKRDEMNSSDSTIVTEKSSSEVKTTVSEPKELK